MAFKLKSGNKVDFKSMGSSPMRVEEVNAFAPSEVNYKSDVATDPVKTSGDGDVKVAGSSAGDLSGVVPTTTTTAPTATEGLSAKLENNESETEQDKLRAQSKKEMYANAWQNSGVGHVTEAVKSIGRGIKKYKAKKSAKNAVKLADAKTAVESGTETYKQAKRVDKAKNKANKKEDREWKKEDKSDKRLAKYNAKKDDKAAKEKVKVAKMKAKIDKERNS